MNNEGWKAYLQFSRKERNAVIILIAIILIVAFLPKWFPKTKLDIQPLALEAEDSTEIQTTNTEATGNYKTEAAVLHPFNFDPNTISEEGFVKMGLRPKLIKTILNYRSKGGKFYNAESLKRIYGLRENEAEILLPYVRIENSGSDKKYSTEKYSTEKFQRNNFNQPLEKPIDINVAAIEDIRRLPGIPVSVAYKILKYREVLGGFNSIDQVKKTYGMTDSILPPSAR
jgi:competence protein ComEA